MNASFATMLEGSRILYVVGLTLALVSASVLVFAVVDWTRQWKPSLRRAVLITLAIIAAFLSYVTLDRSTRVPRSPDFKARENLIPASVDRVRIDLAKAAVAQTGLCVHASPSF